MGTRIPYSRPQVRSGRRRGSSWMRGAVAVVAVLLVAACGSSPASSPASPTGSGPSPTAVSSLAGLGITAGLGVAIRVEAVEGADLADYDVGAPGRFAVTPSGEVWAAASERFGPARPGVWHGTPGTPGTWWPLGQVRGLVVAPDGRVWLDVQQPSFVLAYGWADPSLVTFDAGAWRPVVMPDGATPLVGGGPAVTPDGAVWSLLSPGGLVRFDGTVTRYPPPPCRNVGWGMPSLVAAADGTLWSGSQGTIYSPLQPRECLQRFDGTAWSSVRPLGGTKAVPTIALAADPGGPVWAWLRDPRSVRAWGGPNVVLVRFDGSTWTTVPERPYGDHVGPSSMVAANGTLWAVPEPTKSLYRVDGTTWTRVRVPADLDLPVTAVLAAEPDGSVWVTTDDGILRRVPPGG